MEQFAQLLTAVVLWLPRGTFASFPCPEDFPFPSTLDEFICYNKAEYAQKSMGPCNSWCTDCPASGNGCTPKIICSTAKEVQCPPEPAPFALVKLPEYVVTHGARCLDGSPASFYLQPQSGDSFIIDFEGGGWCYGLEDCASRSTTFLGSSHSIPSICPDDLCNGFLGSDPSFNPDFANWTKVFVNYCDGFSFTGDRDDPVHNAATNTNIWFRGKRNLIAVLEALAKSHGLSKAKRVIISGNSAGGLTVYLHLDQIAAILRTIAPDADVYGFADGGYFLDIPNTLGDHAYRASMQLTFLISNASFGIDPACKARYKSINGSDQRCMFAQNVAPHLKTPFFALEGQYDSWQLGNILQLKDAAGAVAVQALTGYPTANCTNDPKCMGEFQGFRDNMVMHFRPLIDQAKTSKSAASRQHGVFLGACVVHCEATVDGGAIWNGRIWSVSNRTVQKAFSDCYFGRTGCVSVDTMRWPHNPTCLGAGGTSNGYHYDEVLPRVKDFGPLTI